MKVPWVIVGLVVFTMFAFFWSMSKADNPATQPDSPAGVIMDAPSVSSLGTISGVIAATWFVMQYVWKPLFSDMPGLNKVPVGAYVVLTALGIMIAAHSVFHTLAGDTWSLIMETLVAAIGSIGLYHSPGSTQSLQAVTSSTVKTATVLLFLFGLSSLVGCTSSSPFYDGVKSTWAPTGTVYRQYVNNDATLSPASKATLIGNADTMDRLITAEGAAISPLPVSTVKPTTSP